jgi:hypothetical protein
MLFNDDTIRLKGFALERKKKYMEVHFYIYKKNQIKTKIHDN